MSLYASSKSRRKSTNNPTNSSSILTPSNNVHPSPVNSLTDDQRQEIKEAFDLFDTDKDGSIDYHELKVSFRALGFDLKKPEVLKLLRDHDRRGDGLMEYEDFFKIMTDKIVSRDPSEEIRKAFSLFDEHGTGKITLTSLRRVAKELGEPLDEEELQAMIDEFDLDQDGAINQQEFFSIMTDEV
ncbi:hypothetical protein E3P92_02615 [Wallemia ichthyophaga]|uniref:Cell division control protein 31 n=1 Tax=Wallemia ichthyophaga (strain EXF-994 / CBS 113033) TaxID=1299270 RepID=R9ABA0_WALI9|nr:Cell division control protein 31 [Wallemia ichthyophaga EXF-994]TIB12281.1 hypothetical protein E3P92_02615 [Wallemia ichthyophaga]EOQ99451.1 Cell division control protein 31 [Wallemia ichthyophaga EXF-994]TIB32833.1 hypothetical protein E3P84_02401 [Wallemia ichthyophaga]TIB41073.1 hypothetical protein E3P83_02354 [Wallemia ichthyophaga]TIB65899.1 hypothetical protein E3P77_02527 [Wallemia ichthyophaga]